MTNYFTLGNSDCARRIMEMKESGEISDKDFYKVSNYYNKYTTRANSLWNSNLEEEIKRFLDLLLFHQTNKLIHEMKLNLELRTRLQNVISSHHKSLAKVYKSQKPSKKKI